MRRGRREDVRSIQGEVVVHFHPPIDPRQFARKEELLVAVRAAIHSALPETIPRRRLRPNLLLADAHASADLEGNFGGTLRAEIILPARTSSRPDLQTRC